MPVREYSDVTRGKHSQLWWWGNKHRTITTNKQKETKVYVLICVSKIA